MKILANIFDFGNRDRIVLGVFGGLAHIMHIKPIIMRIIVILTFLYLSIIDNLLGTAIILYIAAYLSELFTLWIEDSDENHHELDHIWLAKTVSKH